MSRISLQPLRPFAFLALAAHALLGTGLWWWWTHAGNQRVQPAHNPSLTWISPADFKPPAPAPAVPAPPSQSPPKTAAAAPASDASIQSLLAVVGTQPPPARHLPKAIAIDPAQAIALMKAQQEAAEPVPPAKEAPKSSPAPPVSVQAGPPPAPAPVSKTEPARAPAPLKAEPPAQEPAQVSDISRFITVSKRDTASGPNTSAKNEDKALHLEGVDSAIRDAFMHYWTPPNPETLDVNQRTAHMDMAVDRSGLVLSFHLVKRSGSEAFDESIRAAAYHLEKIHVVFPPSYHQDRYEFQLHFHVE